MAFEKISEEELTSVGVELLDDLPGLAPDAMKAKFEETAKKLLAPKFNKLVEQLEAGNAAGSLGAQLPDGLPEDTEKTVQAILLALMIYVQGHEGKCDNPHKVTADQTGAYSKAETDEKIDEKVVEIGAGDMAMAVYDPQGKSQDIFAYGVHLYKATFLLSGWSGSSSYTQTVALQSVDGGKSVNSNFESIPAGIDNSLPESTKKQLRKAASIVFSGSRTLGSGTVSVSASEKPTVDTEVYFWCKEGE